MTPWPAPGAAQPADAPMSSLLHQLSLSSPLFLLVLLGYGLIRFAEWGKSVSESLTRFVFGLALPAMLFQMMSDLSRLPPVDARLLIAFFGSCLVVFGIGRRSEERRVGKECRSRW